MSLISLDASGFGDRPRRYRAGGGHHTVWFDGDVGLDTMEDMLIEAGLSVSAGGGIAYGTIKATEAVMAEVLNRNPVVGWVISGTITASITLSADAVWWWACDTTFRSGKSSVTILKGRIGYLAASLATKRS